MRTAVLLLFVSTLLGQGLTGCSRALSASSSDEPSVERTIGPAQVATLDPEALTPSTLTPDQAGALATAMERSFRPESRPGENSPEPTATSTPTLP